MSVRIAIISGPKAVATEIKKLTSELEASVTIREQNIAKHGESVNKTLDQLEELYARIKAGFRAYSAKRAVKLHKHAAEAKEALESLKQ